MGLLMTNRHHVENVQRDFEFHFPENQKKGCDLDQLLSHPAHSDQAQNVKRGASPKQDRQYRSRQIDDKIQV